LFHHVVLADRAAPGGPVGALQKAGNSVSHRQQPALPAPQRKKDEEHGLDEARVDDDPKQQGAGLQLTVVAHWGDHVDIHRLGRRGGKRRPAEAL